MEVFEAARVGQMLRSGKSFDAERYLRRFLPPIAFRERSPLCMLLLVHVRIFWFLSDVAAGGPSGARMAAVFANPMDYLLESPYSVRLHKTIARMHADQPRYLACTVDSLIPFSGVHLLLGCPIDRV